MPKEKKVEAGINLLIHNRQLLGGAEHSLLLQEK